MLKRLGVFAAAIAATALVSVAGATSANASGVAMLTPYPSPAACAQAQGDYQHATGKSAFCTEGWDPGAGGTVWWLVTYP